MLRACRQHRTRTAAPCSSSDADSKISLQKQRNAIKIATSIPFVLFKTAPSLFSNSYSPVQSSIQSRSKAPFSFNGTGYRLYLLRQAEIFILRLATLIWNFRLEKSVWKSLEFRLYFLSRFVALPGLFWAKDHKNHFSSLRMPLPLLVKTRKHRNEKIAVWGQWKVKFFWVCFGQRFRPVPSLTQLIILFFQRHLQMCTTLSSRKLRIKEWSFLLLKWSFDIFALKLTLNNLRTCEPFSNLVFT